MVVVQGRVDVTPTSATTVRLAISLPIASALSANSQLSGAGGILGLNEVPVIFGDDANDRAEMQFVAASTAARNIWFMMSYMVI